MCIAVRNHTHLLLEFGNGAASVMFSLKWAIFGLIWVGWLQTRELIELDSRLFDCPLGLATYKLQLDSLQLPSRLLDQARTYAGFPYAGRKPNFYNFFFLCVMGNLVEIILVSHFFKTSN